MKHWMKAFKANLRFFTTKKINIDGWMDGWMVDGWMDI